MDEDVDEPDDGLPLDAAELDAALAEARAIIRQGYEAKPGRNEPCPCLSGLKYKRCCGKRAPFKEL